MAKKIGEQIIEAEEIERNVAAARKALVKAKEAEQAQIANGYRYVQVGRQNKILVKCDKDGKPTAKEEKYLEKLRKITPK
jgi:hypothetical protein